MKLGLFLGTLLSVASSLAVGAVNVEKSYDGKAITSITVQPKQIVRLPLGNFKRLDQLIVVIDVANAVNKDITACLFTDETSAKNYQAGTDCQQGFQKAIAPFKIIAEQFKDDAQVWLVLDNSFANFIAKKLKVISVYKKEFSDADVAQLKAPCVFRSKLDTYSTANWTPIPEQTGQ